MTRAWVDLSGDLTLYGAGDTYKTITAKTTGNRQHFSVGQGQTLTLRWLKLTGGTAGDTNNGGSIYINKGSLHATSCVFFSNSAWNTGGAIFSQDGSAVIEDSIIEDNTVGTGTGGGGVGMSNGAMTITRSLIKDNDSGTNLSLIHI